MDELLEQCANLLDSSDQTGCTPDLSVVESKHLKRIQEIVEERTGQCYGPDIETE